jgi:hypothetical protein
MSRGTLGLALLALTGCGGHATSSPAPAPAAAPAGSVVTLERTPCFGTCPVYRVDIGGDGVVAFDGIRFVPTVGKAAGRIAPAAVDSLVRALDAGGWFGFADEYVMGAPACGPYTTDSPSVITSVRSGDRAKTIRHDYGCTGAPPELGRLERLVDEVAGTGRWTGK